MLCQGENEKNFLRIFWEGRFVLRRGAERKKNAPVGVLRGVIRLACSICAYSGRYEKNRPISEGSRQNRNTITKTISPTRRLLGCFCLRPPAGIAVVRAGAAVVRAAVCALGACGPRRLDFFCSVLRRQPHFKICGVKDKTCY